MNLGRASERPEVSSELREYERAPGAAESISWRPGFVAAVSGWVASRVLVALGYQVGVLVSGRIGGETADRTLSDGLFIWDGLYYLDLSRGWYLAERPEMARFFPLFPGMGWMPISQTVVQHR